MHEAFHSRIVENTLSHFLTFTAVFSLEEKVAISAFSSGLRESHTPVRSRAGWRAGGGGAGLT